MFEPFSSLLRNFSQTYEVEAKLFVSRNLAKIRGHSKEERIDFLNPDIQYCDIYTDFFKLPVLQIAQIYNNIFDFRLLDMAGIKQIQFHIKWPSFSRFRLEDGTYVSTDILEQEFRLVIDVQTAIRTYLDTDDVNEALASYSGKYTIRISKDVSTTVQLQNKQIAAYDQFTDSIISLVPLSVLDIKYIDIIDEPIQNNQLYSVFRTLPGEINIQLYPDYFEYVLGTKLTLYKEINKDARPVYTLLTVTNTQETVIQPVFINHPTITLEAYTKYWSKMFRNARTIPTTVIPTDKSIITKFDWGHPDYIRSNTPVIIINVVHSILLSAYDRAYCVIAYTNNKDWSDSLGQNIGVDYETKNVPQWTISFYNNNDSYYVYETVTEFIKETLSVYAFGYSAQIEEILRPKHYIAGFTYLDNLLSL